MTPARTGSVETPKWRTARPRAHPLADDTRGRASVARRGNAGGEIVETAAAFCEKARRGGGVCTRFRRETPKIAAKTGVGEAGFEPSDSAEFTAIRVDSRTDNATRVDVSARDVVAFGPTKTGDIGTVEDALARAIAQASVVGRWDIVAQLARELEARRLSAAGVRSLVDKRGRRSDQE